jgi:hypothetical protein
MLKLRHVLNDAIVLQNAVRFIFVPQLVFYHGVPCRKRKQFVFGFNVVRQCARRNDARVGGRCWVCAYQQHVNVIVGQMVRYAIDGRLVMANVDDAFHSLKEDEKTGETNRAGFYALFLRVFAG